MPSALSRHVRLWQFCDKHLEYWCGSWWIGRFSVSALPSFNVPNTLEFDGVVWETCGLMFVPELDENFGFGPRFEPVLACHFRSRPWECGPISEPICMKFRVNLFRDWAPSQSKVWIVTFCGTSPLCFKVEWRWKRTSTTVEEGYSLQLGVWNVSDKLAWAIRYNPNRLGACRPSLRCIWHSLSTGLWSPTRKSVGMSTFSWMVQCFVTNIHGRMM